MRATYDKSSTRGQEHLADLRADLDLADEIFRLAYGTHMEELIACRDQYQQQHADDPAAPAFITAISNRGPEALGFYALAELAEELDDTIPALREAQSRYRAAVRATVIYPAIRPRSRGDLDAALADAWQRYERDNLSAADRIDIAAEIEALEIEMDDARIAATARRNDVMSTLGL